MSSHLLVAKAELFPGAVRDEQALGGLCSTEEALGPQLVDKSWIPGARWEVLATLQLNQSQSAMGFSLPVVR